MIKITK